jgi:hypothetical protein
MYFYSNAANTIGSVIQNVVRDFYNHPQLKSAHLVISEYGTNDNDPVRLSSFAEGNLACLTKYEKYLGFELFAFADESWKGSGSGENNYGIVTESGVQKKTYAAITAFKASSGFQNLVKKSF